MIIRRKKQVPTKEEVLQTGTDKEHLLSTYNTLYLGHASDPAIRAKGSSGGVGTTLFHDLLKDKTIDGILAVGSPDTESLDIDYHLAKSLEDITKLAGSKYIYIPFKKLKEKIEAYADQRLAVIAQPCHVPALRQLQKKKFPNIKIIFSFFCGYNISKMGTEYLVEKSHLPKEKIEHIEYRGGEYPGGFRITSKDDQVIQFGKECYELVDIMFLLKGCERCPFYMGEFADIVLGDAWLKDHKNMTAIIARTELGDEILKKSFKEKSIELFKLEENDLIRMHWHNLKFKKYGHGRFLKFVVFTFRDFLHQKIIPFKLMLFISRVRRKFAIGVTIPKLKKIDVDED